MPVHSEADAPIAVITLDRPEVANAIDRPTAQALADAFRRFDADASLSVAVLTGAHGTFCAGAMDGGAIRLTREIASRPQVALRSDRRAKEGLR